MHEKLSEQSKDTTPSSESGINKKNQFNYEKYSMVTAGKLEGKARISQCQKENYKTLMGDGTIK